MSHAADSFANNAVAWLVTVWPGLSEAAYTNHYEARVDLSGPRILSPNVPLSLA